jgi:hypothetical protein
LLKLDQRVHKAFALGWNGILFGKKKKDKITWFHYGAHGNGQDLALFGFQVLGSWRFRMDNGLAHLLKLRD